MIKTSIVASFAIATFLLPCARALGEASLRSQFDLSDYIHEARPVLAPLNHAIFKVAFSPDETALALTTSSHETNDGPLTHLLVLDILGHRTRFETGLPISTVHALEWSIDGTLLLVQSPEGSWIVDVTKSTSCHVGDGSSTGAGFVSPEVFVIDHNSPRTTGLRFYDIRCNRVEEATVPERARTIDTSVTAKIMALSGDYGDVRLLRGPDWKTYTTITIPGVGLGVKIFDSGKGVCAGQDAGRDHATLRCWDVGGAVPRPLTSWSAARNARVGLVAAAAAASLVVFLDSERFYNRFTERERVTFKRWVVWDAQRGIIVNQLPAKTQVVRLGGELGIDFTMAYVSALSASGSLFAIGGAGTIEIYALTR